MRFAPKQKRNKYGNTWTKAIDGKNFQSKKEAKRYDELKLLEKAGEISKLKLQPSFKLEVSGNLITRYRADFIYLDHLKKGFVVEDVKGMKTKEYIIKANLFKALYPQFIFLET